MTMPLEHLTHHPERDMSLSKENIRREMIVEYVDIWILSEPLCEGTSRTEKNWIYTREYVSVYLFLGRERLGVMIYDSGLKNR